MTDLFAHARRDDPRTSHDAARAISPRLTEIQQRVESYAYGKGHGGFTDAQMSAELEDAGSTLRTRRAELVEKALVVDSGMRRTFGGSPRKRVVWVHRLFADPIRLVRSDDEAPASDHSLADTELANSLDSIAATLEREGRDRAAATIRRGAARIRSG